MHLLFAMALFGVFWVGASCPGRLPGSVARVLVEPFFDLKNSAELGQKAAIEALADQLEYMKSLQLASVDTDRGDQRAIRNGGVSCRKT